MELGDLMGEEITALIPLLSQFSGLLALIRSNVSFTFGFKPKALNIGSVCFCICSIARAHHALHQRVLQRS